MALLLSSFTTVDGTVGRTGATCLACQSPVKLEHIRSEGRAGRMGAQLMAIVAEVRQNQIGRGVAFQGFEHPLDSGSVVREEAVAESLHDDTRAGGAFQEEPRAAPRFPRSSGVR